MLNILGLRYSSWFSHAFSSRNEQGNRHLGLEAWNIWVPLYTLSSAAWLVYSCGVLWMVTWRQWETDDWSVSETDELRVSTIESNETKCYHTSLSATAWLPTDTTHIYCRYLIRFKVLAVRVWFKTMVIITAIDLCNLTIQTSPFNLKKKKKHTHTHTQSLSVAKFTVECFGMLCWGLFDLYRNSKGL